MQKGFIAFIGIYCWVATLTGQNLNPKSNYDSGVPIDLVHYRSRVISKIQYNLDFKIPHEKADSIIGKENLSLYLSESGSPLVLDFKQNPDHLLTLLVNGTPISFNFRSEHIYIDSKWLRKGENRIKIDFIAGNEALNRNANYFYALFVPDRARTVFPCFDQPDLKAKFCLALDLPHDWKALANGILKDTLVRGDRKTYFFENSDLLSTYLFSFTGGKYTEVQKTIGGRKMDFLYRETDSNKINLSLDSVFKDHFAALNFLEKWTGISYPFQKIGFVAIPDFQFGGMEHPGEVQYRASALFLDKGATREQMLGRLGLISHETSHMWFGDMVTMKWFNDVWMKEVFANFMADKITEKLMGSATFNLKFLTDHYPAAYSIDRSLGANPIRQYLTNLNEAGSLYGNIIYNKAPIMMRQLESLMGKSSFQIGVKEYLKKYAYKNADWNDLILILSKHTPIDLKAWNQVWVNKPGRPIIGYTFNQRRKTIHHFILSQKPEQGKYQIWPQVFKIALVYSSYSKDLTVNLNKPSMELTEAEGLPKPDYILFNSDGMGYGLFPANPSISFSRLESPLKRASAYINAYENMLSGRFYSPLALLNAFKKALDGEPDETNNRLLTGYISHIYWEFISESDRGIQSLILESALWKDIENQPSKNIKKILFKTYQDIYLGKEAGKRLFQIWKTHVAPPGIILTEEDYTTLALSLALKSDTITQVLQDQLGRITNPDRKNRLIFMMPALSNDLNERDQFFQSLSELKNRQKEAWVLSALYYLHHPLRQASSIKYLTKSLEMLSEIKSTGDLFFPQSWLTATFGLYNQPQAYKTVKDFLKTHPVYNAKLRDKILQSTDDLFRAQKLFYSVKN